ncbi:hypothetical protein DPV78_012061 [Talaromyces pinophilus]|nr:hypothetical protein DPV78_012061 [Talaromyces pinophilus]
MEHVTNSPESSFGRIPSTRSNDDHVPTLYPLGFYRTLFQADIAQTLATTQDDHLFVEQPFMAEHAGNAYGNPGFVPQSGGYTNVENPFRRTQPLSTGDLFGLRAQAADDGHPPSGTTTAMSNPYSQDLHPGNHDTPASNGHVETTPELSTVLEGVTTGSSTSPVLPSNRGSQEPCMSVWNPNPAGSNAPAGRNRKRRKMTEDELVRNRALKAAGGACESCRRRKKKCPHKDDQLVLSVPASTPAPTLTSTPTPVPGPAPAVPAPAPAPIPSHRVSSTTNRHILVPRTRVVRPRPRPDDINRREAPVPQHLHHHQQQQQQQRHNPSVSSYGRTLNPSMFSPSEGGASSNGTMSSAQSDANTFAIGYHPEMGVGEQIGLYTAGFGQQFK